MKNYKINGFTLIEVLVVIVIIAIVGAIAIPSIMSHIENTKEQVCQVNRVDAEKHYHTYLTVENTMHTDILFRQYLNQYDKELCPDQGEINYVNEEIHCSIHDGEEVDDKGNNDNGVPYL